MKKPPLKLLIFTAFLMTVSLIVGVFAFSVNTYNPVTALLGELLVPIQKGTNSAVDGIYNFFGYFYKYNALVAENEALQDRIAEYQALERRYYAAIDENESLRVLARLSKANPTYVYEFCHVTAINMNSYQQTITIDKGALDGIQLLNCAIVREGVVGYVSKVGLNFSEITVLTDPDVKIGALISRPQEIAVTEGDAELMTQGKLKLSYLSNESAARVGDVVETSGYGDIFPKGLIVGYIDEIQSESHGMNKYAVITPSADIEKLKKIYVIKSFT